MSESWNRRSLKSNISSNDPENALNPDKEQDVLMKRSTKTQQIEQDKNIPQSYSRTHDFTTHSPKESGLHTSEMAMAAHKHSAKLSKSTDEASDNDTEGQKYSSSNEPKTSRYLNVAPNVSTRQRRKSPVTVQEWVASLPSPHLLQMKDNLSSKKQDTPNKLKESSNSSEVKDGAKAFESRYPRDQKEELDSDVCKKRKLCQDSYNNERPTPSSMDHGEVTLDMTQDGGISNVVHVVLDEDPDDLNLGAEADFNVNSKEVKRSAAECMKYESQHHDQALGEQEDEKENNILKIFPERMMMNNRKPDPLSEALHRHQVFNGSGNLEVKHPLRGISLEAKRRLFLRTHEQHASFQSDISAKTASSVDSVLYSREVDPAELLMDLGFGGKCSDLLARIPARFFQPSQAKGISVEDFLRRQEELTERFDSGFSGYHGLNGNNYMSRPSALVEKILDKIRMQDRALKRQMSVLSQWTSTDSFYPVGHSPLISMNGQSAVSKLSFASVVGHARHQHLSFTKNVTPPLKGARAFKAVAHSVLSPANRRFIDNQNEEANRKVEDRKIILGNETFKVNEELKVIDEVEEEEDALGKPMVEESNLGMLMKQNSTLSVASSCSINSDWSDEELDELEKILDDIQERSLGQKKSAQERWKKLKKSRAIVLQRLKMLKRLSSNNSSVMSNSSDLESSNSFHSVDSGEDNSLRLALKQDLDFELREIKALHQKMKASPLDSPKLRRLMDFDAKLERSTRGPKHHQLETSSLPNTSLPNSRPGSPGLPSLSPQNSTRSSPIPPVDASTARLLWFAQNDSRIPQRFSSSLQNMRF